MIPTQSDEARTEIVKPHVRTAAPVPDKVEESGPIEVAIDFEDERDSRGRLRISGETNLPNGTRLAFSLQAKALNYLAQDKGQVQNGRFQSAWFTRKGAPLPAGVYEVGVTVPVYKSHPESVKRRLGPGLEAMTGPLVRTMSLDFMGKVASIERKVEVLNSSSAAQKEVEEMDYWIDPGRHFAWSDLDYALTSMPGVLTISGRIKNVGPRDASEVHVKISMRDAQGREVGRGNMNKFDGLASGASWAFNGLLTVRKPGGVELYVGPESITAFGS